MEKVLAGRRAENPGVPANIGDKPVRFKLRRHIPKKKAQPSLRAVRAFHPFPDLQPEYVVDPCEEDGFSQGVVGVGKTTEEQVQSSDSMAGAATGAGDGPKLVYTVDNVNTGNEVS